MLCLDSQCNQIFTFSIHIYLTLSSIYQNSELSKEYKISC